MRISILLLFLVFQAFTSLKAQQIFKTNGSSSSTFFLGNVDYARKSQCLYPPSLLTNEVSGKIKKIYFKYGTGTVNNQVLTDFKIKFGQTSDATITGINFYTGLSTVLDSATFTIPSGTNGTWFSIKVDSTFDYDATKSIIVEVSFQTSTIQVWGTLGTSNTPTRKLISEFVDATTGDGSSGTLQDFGFDLTTITSNSPKVFVDNSFTIFPNPATNSIMVNRDTDLKSSANYSVRNSLGKIILSGKFSNHSEIDIQVLPAGVYYFESEVNKKLIRRSFIKVN